MGKSYHSACRCVGTGLVALLLAAPVQAGLSPEEQLAAFAAAGFTRDPDGRYVRRCREETPTLSYTPGNLEERDLNGDGQPEALITEGSLFCYGAPHVYFAIVAKVAGTWQVLLDGVGDPLVLPTAHQGWPDIEIGGPGPGPFPRFRWTGSEYARVQP